MLADAEIFGVESVAWMVTTVEEAMLEGGT
jgi:hypothetical protein